MIHRKRHAVEFPVLPAKTAIQAIVGTVVGHIQGCEEHQAVSVDVFFDFMRRLKDRADKVFIFRLQQHGHIFGGKALEFKSLVDDLDHLLRIGIA